MAAKIKCFIKRPDEEYGHVTYISVSLENLQRNVGGYVESVTLIPQVGRKPGMVVLCDEDGRLKNKPFNCTYFGISFVGDILVLGYKDGEFCSVPIEWDAHKQLIDDGRNK